LCEYFVIPLPHNFLFSVQVHIRVASPPIRHACYMGINIPTREELVANQMSLEEIRVMIGELLRFIF
jgi:glutamine phosphoribosylpyrophosphate amidotransferase